MEELVAWHACEVEAVLREVQAHAEAGRWCVGSLAYEAAEAFDPALQTHVPAHGWPLVRFAVYARASAWQQAAAGSNGGDCSPWRSSIGPEDYARQVARAKQAMADGTCYQVNLTTALEARFAGQPAAWMERLRLAQPEGYLLWLDCGEQQVLSASPELFFDWKPGSQGGQLLCRPTKGTAPRHADATEDELARRHLRACEKERAENVMIVDLLRSDMGRIAQHGSVRVEGLFEVRALPTVWQMTSSVTARTRPGLGLFEILRALFPCGSVTGAPKASAMRWIRALEDGPRGIYCGAAGIVRPGGAATFSVPIRTVVAQRAAPGQWIARYGVGSGLTVYANARDEWRELRAKARVLERSSRSFALVETLRLEQGRYWLMQEHLQRIRRSACYFGYPCDARALEEALLAVAQDRSEGTWRVRLVLQPSGQADVHTDAFVPAYGPVAFALARRPLDPDGADHEFIVHKTSRRAHYDSRLVRHEGVFDTLMVNPRGELTEFTRGNLALRLDGRWLTPAAGCGLLPGTLRNALLAKGVLKEAVLTVRELDSAEDFAFFNSLRGWLQARYLRHLSPQGCLIDSC